MRPFDLHLLQNLQQVTDYSPSTPAECFELGVQSGVYGWGLGFQVSGGVCRFCQLSKRRRPPSSTTLNKGAVWFQLLYNFVNKPSDFEGRGTNKTPPSKNSNEKFGAARTPTEGRFQAPGLVFQVSGLPGFRVPGFDFPGFGFRVCRSRVPGFGFAGSRLRISGF